jgi:uncharacterized protein (DUF302 family)
MSYYFNKVLENANFNDVYDRVVSELEHEGFGVLTQINVDETLKKKLGVNFKKYVILGACNPHAAYKLLRKEDKVGVFLPCNVVIEEHENGSIEVFAVDPIAAFKAVNNNTIGCHLIDIQEKLKRVIEKI